VNSALGVSDLERFAPLESGARALLRHEMEHERLSGRGYHRIRRTARTIADLRDGDSGSAADLVTEADVALALRFRAALAAATVTA
jgi:magnesium chelatase family protein